MESKTKMESKMIKREVEGCENTVIYLLYLDNHFELMIQKTNKQFKVIEGNITLVQNAFKDKIQIEPIWDIYTLDDALEYISDFCKALVNLH